LGERDALAILSLRATADFFDAAVAGGACPKAAANAVKGEIMRLVNDGKAVEIPILTQDFVKALRLAQDNKITQEGLKTAISSMFMTNKPLDQIVAEKGLIVTEDSSLITDVVREVLAAEPDAVAKCKNGNAKVMSYLFGKCMGKLRGKALPASITEELKKALEN
jgi:aspartyl-tRNA(Asn)/glutamyl-tRNA(Gln) amidotransferase subunit B